MSKEETISYIKAYLDGDTSIGNIIPLRKVLESAVEHLSKTTRQRLAKWSETPEGKAAYEKVAKEMRAQIKDFNVEAESYIIGLIGELKGYTDWAPRLLRFARYFYELGLNARKEG